VSEFEVPETKGLSFFCTPQIVILRSVLCDEGSLHSAGTITAVDMFHRSFGPQKTRTSG
jgi:hypothetical protein